jgi:Tfp pilus assembly protein PilF
MRVLPMFLLVLLSACATAPMAPRHEELFHDELFAAPTERIAAEDIFTPSEAMRRFLRENIAERLSVHGPQHGLTEAMRGAGEVRLYGPQYGLVAALRGVGELRLEYDATATRNAAETFAAKSGNCLSLVIMTAALAKELGVPVRYQSAYLEETWSRSGDLLVRSGHVNVTLESRLVEASRNQLGRSLTVDFLPAEDLRGLRTVEIGEGTIVAMYMNNRAVEALVRGEVDNAYAWARESIRRDPTFVSALNTLGVIYLRQGALAFAEQVFGRLLTSQRDNTRALANLAEVLTKQGRITEAAAMRERLAQLETAPPFHYFNLGVAAMKRDDYVTARDYFAKEIARAEHNAEFHHWMAVASFRLDDRTTAARHLALAREYSTSRGDRDLYAAKLAWLRAQASHQVQTVQ